MGVPKNAGTRPVSLLLTGCCLLLLTGCNALMDAQVPGDHPPAISNLSVSPTTIRSGETFVEHFSYNDAGGDIASCLMRDDMSGNRYEITALATDTDGNDVYVFPGTSGSADVQYDFTGAQAGVHHLVKWCIDEQGSISNTVEVNLTVVD
jgi:hypothetical protein